MKNIRVFFLSENFQFLEEKFSRYLNRHVFVMTTLLHYVVVYTFLSFVTNKLGLNHLEIQYRKTGTRVT